ncbi:MAG: hypothetical protein V2G33_06205 [bacterium JZ-2024 1]
MMRNGSGAVGVWGNAHPGVFPAEESFGGINLVAVNGFLGTWV